MVERFTFPASDWSGVFGTFPTSEGGSSVDVDAVDPDRIILPSGRKVYANCGIIGINASLDVYDGYDGDVFDWPKQGTYGTSGWSDADLHALADLMLERWGEFKRKIGQQQLSRTPAD